MKLYRSLIYRELKLTRRHYLLMLILFLLMLICILIPVILSGDDEPDAAADSSGMGMLGLMVAMVGGAAAGLDNELHKADINVGWRRYRIVLPPTALQSAAADLLVKLMYVLIFGVLTGAFCVLINVFAGGMDSLAVMNQFLMFTTVFFLFSLVYDGILMLAKDEKDLKKYGTMASISV
ncbi:MAG: ABC-2 transporter permease, partial [Ruminococcus sp.]|nr:ABC-2 transporter permease [Ruminococcus sp.]